VRQHLKPQTRPRGKGDEARSGARWKRRHGTPSTPQARRLTTHQTYRSAGWHSGRMRLAEYDAMLLTGGRAARMGGPGKPGLEVGGRSLAARVAGAVTDARRLVVVGPGYGVPAAVFTREEPPGAGPVAAIAAGLAHVTAPYVAVLAGDLPFLDQASVRVLQAAAADHDVALLVDDAGRDQLLCAVWRTPALSAALGRLPALAGSPVRALLAAPLRVARRTVSPATGPPPWFDCDTPADLARARRWT
jgi:molybdenum cofactor guanylyltransferase